MDAMSLAIRRLCLAAVALVGIAWWTGQWWAGRTETEMRQRLLRQAVGIARSIDPELVRELSFTEADTGALAFEYIRHQMIALGEHVSQRGIYSLALRDANLVFGPENYHEDDPMASPPGTPYEEPSAEDLAVFSAGHPLTMGPVSDEYGTFVCALAPILDPNTGEVLMAVGMDILADDWQITVDRARHKTTFTVLMAGLAFGGGAAAIRRRRRHMTLPRLAPAADRRDQKHSASRTHRHMNTGLLVGMGLLAVAFLAVVLIQSWHWTHEEIRRSTDQQARLAVEFGTALRNYVGEHIRPEMERYVAPGDFTPETMSTSFIARRVFDSVRKTFPDSILRFASTNPRNPANRATPSEEALIRHFEQHPEIDTWSGAMQFFENGQTYSVHAVARRFEPSCLQCHGRPEDAPATLVERYGATAGFGRQVGEVSLDLAAIPVSTAYVVAGERVWRHMLAALAMCVVFLGGIAVLIRLDIVQRHRSETSLRASEQRLASIIQGSPIPTFTIDANHRIIHWNRAMERLTGITADRIVGTTEHWRAFYANERPCMADLLVDDGVETIPQWYPDGFTKSDLINEAYEASNFFPDIGQGGRWLHLTAAVVRGDRGRLVGVVETLQDFTERKKAEEELRQSQERFKIMTDSAQDAILMMDPQGRITFYNRAAETIFGWTACESMGKDLHALLAPEKYAGAYRSGMAHFGCTGTGAAVAQTTELTALHKNGTEFPIEISLAAVKLKDQWHAIGIVRDITERKRAEEELKESLSLLEATLESTADGIVVVDGLGKIKNFNRQFQDLWRLPGEVLDTHDDDQALAAATPLLVDPNAFVTQVRELYNQRDQEGNGTLHFEDGRVVEYYSKPQFLGDRITGRVWSFRDVTETYCAQQKQERLLRQVAAVNKELSHFAYVVSHDLKAPLRGIKMLSEWLCADYGETLDDEGKESLRLLQSRVERMHDLIEGVLQYSRVGRIKEDIVEVDLDALLPTIVDAIAPPQHITVRMDGRLPVIECERTRITQVFQNLLTNAVKYSDKPAGEIVVACTEDSDAWTFSVADNGPGIEEKHFDKIFQIFQTLAPRDEFESTGVGLTLVKKIVEHYGGKIWLVSEVGKGTTFFFTLSKRSRDDGRVFAGNGSEANGERSYERVS
mgnify:CR=1 FL=1